MCLATVTRCDLSPRFFCTDATSLCEFEAIRYESTSLNRIAADKSHLVIVAFGGVYLKFNKATEFIFYKLLLRLFSQLYPEG